LFRFQRASSFENSYTLDMNFKFRSETLSVSRLLEISLSARVCSVILPWNRFRVACVYTCARDYSFPASETLRTFAFVVNLCKNVVDFYAVLLKVQY